jgi:hypothetical protein
MLEHRGQVLSPADADEITVEAVEAFRVKCDLRRAELSRRNALPLNVQLARLNEDHTHDVGTRSAGPLSADLDRFRDKVHELYAADLRKQLGVDSGGSPEVIGTDLD